MRSVGVGVANIVDDGDLTLFEEFGDTGHCGVESETIGKGDDLVGFEAEGRAKAMVFGVKVGDYGVEAIVSAGELADNEDVIRIDFASIGEFDDIRSGDGGEPGRGHESDGEDAAFDK